MDQVRHKCGYCGWVFRFNTNFIDHKCFKDYIEEVDHINVDENYIVTILKKNPTIVEKKENLDELLIEAVRRKRALYDFCVPASERTMLRKNALWMEVSNLLQGSLSPEEAKARWKYLRDNYIKARKKIETYIPSGSAGTAEKKSKFQYYDLMRFLNDSLQTRPTVSLLTESNVTNEMVTSLNIENEKHKSVTIAEPLTTLSSINNSSPTDAVASLYTSLQTSSLTKNCRKRLILPEERATGSKQKKNDMQEALIEALKEPATQPIDPLDGFLLRLGEGMKRLSYRDRARLEIRFLILLAEMEDSCFNPDSDRLT